MRARIALAPCLVVLLGPAATAAAAIGQTGDPRATALARAEARAYTRIPVEVYTQKGYIQMTDEEGRSSYLRFEWGRTKLNPGWVWATEHATVALRAGRVVWWRDDLTPPPCTKAGLCHQVPVELVSNRTGAYSAFGNATTHTCFARLKNTAVVAGSQWNSPEGDFSAPVFGPGIVKLTYSFPLAKGVTARETDTLSSHTDLVRSTYTVAANHVFRSSATYPAHAPAAPKVNLCAT
jgi:hypothetical protein